jgi:hypothetical protein
METYNTLKFDGMAINNVENFAMVNGGFTFTYGKNSSVTLDSGKNASLSPFSIGDKISSNHMYTYSEKFTGSKNI